MSLLMDSFIKASDNDVFNITLHYIIWNCHFLCETQLNIGNFIRPKLMLIAKSRTRLSNWTELNWMLIVCFRSDQISHSVVSDSLRPHESQHARPPCPSPTPRVHSVSCPSSRWCHPASHLILCRPLLLLPPIPPSIRVFSNESTLCMLTLC